MTRPVPLVDDYQVVREALTFLLETISIKVRSFASPAAFLARLDGQEPGCLILDNRIPMISGLKLQERLTERDLSSERKCGPIELRPA